MDQLRRIFRLMNKYFMVPVFRLGLSPLLCNPVAGYIMAIKNVGRKSGKLYYSPTNYAISEGKVYCMAGFGRKTDWYLNIKAHPNVELMLPGRTIAGTAEEITDPDHALKICRQIMLNAGFAAFMEGYNPRKAPDEAFKNTLERAVVLQITPTGIGRSALDAGGWHWVTLLLILIFLIFR